MDRPIDKLMSNVVEFEWNRMERFRGDVTFQTALALAFGSAVKFVSSSPPTGATELFLFWTATIAAGVGLIAQVVFLILAWYGYTYRYLPPPKDLQWNYDELSRLSVLYIKRSDPREHANSLFEAQVGRLRVKIAQRNHENNTRRSAFLQLEVW